MRKQLFDHKASFARKKIRPTPPAHGMVRVSPNHVAYLGGAKEAPKPVQVMSLPPFPGHPLPARKSSAAHVTTAIGWLKYYFDDVPPSVIQRHFNKGLVQLECRDLSCSSTTYMRKIKHSDVMEVGSRVYVPISVAEGKVCKRFNVIPSGTLYPNADEIAYLQRLVKYKDSALLVLNKPPKLPVKGNLSVHNGMDALAAAALTYDYSEGPKLVHRFDRESSGLLLMGRTKESIYYLHRLLGNGKKFNGDVDEKICQRYWALVIGSPEQKEGLVCAPLTNVRLDDGETERVILAQNSGLESSQEAITEYRVLGPTINGCSWIELHPHTICKHQLRVHCAEALGTPIVGDYKYGWFFHSRWKQMPRIDYEPTSGEAYKLRRPKGLDVQKGSVLSKVPLLHLHCREIVMPNIAKLLEQNSGDDDGLKPDILRFVAPMPSHMKISWNLMASYLV